jgi:3-phosphoshikimate 1-carboxyvinyltransferase
MQWRVSRSTLHGKIVIPPSKSHTIRAVLIATLAAGRSRIQNPLLEGDGNSALHAARALGARIEIDGADILVDGIGGDLSGGLDFIDVGNSGTSTRLFCVAAALGGRPRTFDGDSSLRTRVMRPLFDALAPLGATATLLVAGGGDIPFTIQGPLHGGATTVQGISSQYVSALLLSCPLVSGETTIDVPLLNEKPYVRLTLWWLDKMGIRYFASNDLSRFIVPGHQSHRPISERIPGDFSGATFGAVAAALTGGEIELDNIDFSDPQGDRGIFELLAAMGAMVRTYATHAIVRQGAMTGREIDLNSMPDALPALAVLGCMATGTTRLLNVKQARIKETDRIAVMARELKKMGARIEELPDGLVVHQSRLVGCRVDGHGDHRVVMALALAGMIAEGATIIDTAEAAAVTYPSFADDFRSLGAAIAVIAQ